MVPDLMYLETSSMADVDVKVKNKEKPKVRLN